MLTAFERLGLWPVLIIPGGILLNLGCVGLLSFLWFGGDSNLTWKTLVLNNWAPRLVVIVSLAIRLVVGAHTAISISMLAALVLERSETPIHLVPEISMMRAQNSGGIAALVKFQFLFDRPSSLRRLSLAVLAVLLLLLLLGLQLTSTALLSDFGPRNMTSLPTHGSIAYAVRSTDYESGFALDSATAAAETQGLPALLAQFPTYPAFAEYSEPPTTSRDGLFDTGPLIRAFLPLEKAQRVALVRYSGMAALFDNRVVCARPSSELTDVKLTTTFSKITGQIGITLSGSIDTRLEIPRFNGTTRTTIYCRDFELPYGGGAEWPVSICSASLQDTDYTSGLISKMQEMPLAPWQEQQGGPNQQETFILVNTTGDWMSMTGPSFASGDSKNITIEPTSMTGAGEWLKLSLGHHHDAGISLSMCYIAPLAQHKTIDIVRRSSSLNEPTTFFDIDQPQGFDTLSIRRQLGASSLIIDGHKSGPSSSLSDRGLFEFIQPTTPTNESSWVAYSSNGTYTGQATDYYWAFPSSLSTVLFGDWIESSDVPCTSLCYTCLTTRQISYIHPIHLTVFNRIVQDTGGSAGLALQSLLTSYCAQTYYTKSYLFSDKAETTQWTTVNVLAPVQATFFGLVVVAIAAQMLVVISLTAWFILDTRHTMLGNAWQALAQVCGWRTAAAAAWLGEDDACMTVKDVKRSVEAAGLGGVRVGLLDACGDGEKKIAERGRFGKT